MNGPIRQSRIAALTRSPLLESEAIRQKRHEKNTENGVQPERNNNGEIVKDLTQIPLTGVAYLLDSLKHPDRLERLRAVYGPAFISVGIYSPAKYVNNICGVRPSRRMSTVGSKSCWSAMREVRMMMKSSASVFPMRSIRRNFVINATLPDTKLEKSMSRLVELIFGNVHLTPTLDELGMYLARAAQVRSGSLARQIGAAILRDDGSLVGLVLTRLRNQLSVDSTGLKMTKKASMKVEIESTIASTPAMSSAPQWFVKSSISCVKNGLLIDKYGDAKSSSVERLQALELQRKTPRHVAAP